MGLRKGLIDSLEARRIPFALWVESVPKKTRGWDFCFHGPFPRSIEDVEAALATFPRGREFSHVFAASEGAVLPASIVRRRLAARGFAEGIVLLCRDKLLMKQHLQQRGLPMTSFLDGNLGEPAERIVQLLGTPVVVKDRMQSGGRGIQYSPDAAALVRARRPGQILERFVDAPEVSVESWISGGRILFSSVTEYNVKGHVNIVPANLSDDLLDQLLDLNRQAIESLGIPWGLTHLEAFLSPSGPLFGEIALRPPGGYIMDLIEMVYGFSPWDAALDLELGREPAPPAPPRGHAAAIVLHPGEGVVSSVRGLADVRTLDGVRQARVRIRVGDSISPRLAVGNDVGHVLIHCESRRELLDRIRDVERLLKIEQS
jgi:biotin carboxylase